MTSVYPPDLLHSTLDIFFKNSYFFLLPVNMPSEPITLRRETTLEKRAEVWAWYKTGKTYSEIARLADLTKSTVRKIMQRLKKKIG